MDTVTAGETVTDGDPRTAVEVCRELARTTLAEHAADVDRRARFPEEGVRGLRAAGLLAAAAPVRIGGLGADVPAMADMASALARGCGATAMIWAMQQVQLACLAPDEEDPPLRAEIEAIVREQRLVASATSEAGVGGDLRTSRCAVEPAADAGPGEARRLVKHATTVSYGPQADAFLVSARRAPGSGPGDQVAVLLAADRTDLEALGPWDSLGMRGTCSPPMRLRGRFEGWRVLARPFAEIVERAMTPLAHVLWSAVWLGLAAEAADRAVAWSRKRAAGGPAPSPGVAELRWRTAAARAQLAEAARRADAVLAGTAAPTVGFAVELNSLKLAASESAVQVALLALRVCGMAGYAETGPYSVARIVRDLLSAPLMIGNDRLAAANATLALMSR
ncbi:acyl-CoA dehydrogenase family protein [Spirillospora sp. NPDC049024]